MANKKVRTREGGAGNNVDTDTPPQQDTIALVGFSRLLARKHACNHPCAPSLYTTNIRLKTRKTRNCATVGLPYTTIKITQSCNWDEFPSPDSPKQEGHTRPQWWLSMDASLDVCTFLIVEKSSLETRPRGCVVLPHACLLISYRTCHTTVCCFYHTCDAAYQPLAWYCSLLAPDGVGLEPSSVRQSRMAQYSANFCALRAYRAGCLLWSQSIREPGEAVAGL